MRYRHRCQANNYDVILGVNRRMSEAGSVLEKPLRRVGHGESARNPRRFRFIGALVSITLLALVVLSIRAVFEVTEKPIRLHLLGKRSGHDFGNCRHGFVMLLE